jgi:glutamate synthase domain-containing protein 2
LKFNRNHIAALAAAGAAVALGAAGAAKLGRVVVNKIHDHFVSILTRDLYDENLWELISSTVRVGPQVALETSLRAQDSKLLERPMGTPRKYAGLDDIKFNIAQLYSMPTPIDTDIYMDVVIGPYSKKPVILKHPMMMAPMAYGIALSKEVKIALAKGTAEVGTAAHVGAGAFLPEERAAAKYLFYQYNRGNWGKTPEILRQCDAIEIQFGQGAYAGVGHIIKSQLMDAQLRKDFKKGFNENLVTQSRQPEVQNPEDLVRLVQKLKSITGGVPIGAKIAAGKYLETDLYWVCSSGVDFVVVDGSDAATKGSPPILQDDFGVPTVFAIDRAYKWMQKHGFKERISLIASGLIRTPGDALKVCALGADACQIGAIALFAISNPQITKALPFEPPTTLTWYGEQFADEFDIESGAKAIKNFLASCKLEMEEGIRALGKTALSQVNREDLMTINEVISKGLQIPMVYEAYDPLKDQGPKVRKVKL